MFNIFSRDPLHGITPEPDHPDWTPVWLVQVTGTLAAAMRGKEPRA